MSHLGVGRSHIEWKVKVKTQISVFPWAKIGQNDHSNPYIESPTVLSDYVLYIIIYYYISYVDDFYCQLFVDDNFRTLGMQSCLSQEPVWQTH